MASVGSGSSGMMHNQADCMRTWAVIPHTCPRPAFESCLTHTAVRYPMLSVLQVQTAWTLLNLAYSWHVSVFFFFCNAWTLCTHSPTGCDVSPCHLGDRDGCYDTVTVVSCFWGFFFLQCHFSHGLPQIDTSPSVAAVHPALNHWRAIGARLSFTLSSSCSLSPSPSICHYLSIELLAPARAHKIFSISSINREKSSWVYMMNCSCK